ncbi:MAG: thermonuclease family protein [candidate division Zixibacteria bacterium]|nr:thermonuclease family protein [candidate division Zixibacteria bacterium]
MRRSKSVNRTIWRIVFVLVVVALIVGYRLVEEIGPDRHPDERFVVVRVVDGDTVELRGGDRLRLLAVDTPEKGQPFYEEACRFLSDQVLAKQVEIIFGGKRRDGYGRLLGFLYIDNVCINEAILRSGMGCLYLFEDNIGLPQIEPLLAAQVEAINGDRGIWSVDYRPEDHYVAAKGSFRFHRPGCRAIARTRVDNRLIFDSREEAALIGLSPCRTCRP